MARDLSEKEVRKNRIFRNYEVTKINEKKGLINAPNFYPLNWTRGLASSVS